MDRDEFRLWRLIVLQGAVSLLFRRGSMRQTSLISPAVTGQVFAARWTVLNLVKQNIFFKIQLTSKVVNIVNLKNWL